MGPLSRDVRVKVARVTGAAKTRSRQIQGGRGL
jgi:hypothetical protein